MRQLPLAVTFGLLMLPLAWPIDPMAHTPPQSMVRDGDNHTAKDKQKANDASRRRAQEEARRKAQQEAARRKAQEEAHRKAQQDAARRKTQEESFRREPVQKTSGHRPAQFKPQPVPFKPRNQQTTGQNSSFSTKSNGAVQRPAHGAVWNPTSVKPSRKSKADLGPQPPTNTDHAPWLLNSAPIKNTAASPPDTDEASTVCWWEPAPSPVIDIDIHFGSGFSCWTPVDHHHWWFGGGWHWHHHASTCHSFGWGFLCWSRPGCHTLGWRPWWDRPNCVEWWTPTWNWCSPSVHYVTLPPPPPPSSQQCWDALNYGDLGLARRDFLKRLAADPFDADSRLGLALCEGLRGNASGMQAELLRVLEDDPWVCMSWRPGSLRDQLKGLLRDAGLDARRVDVPERWVVVGVLAAVAQKDGVALAGLQRALTHPRAIPGAELLHRLVQDRQLAF